MADADPVWPHIRLMPEPTTREPCPICGKPADPRHRPFCSRRCKDVDLNRWLSGVYAVPAVEDEQAAEEDGKSGAPPH